MNQEPTLTEEERKRLDRQRFIGVETQKRYLFSHLFRLLAFRVFITPANGINTELAKNLILAGVNVSIYDDALVTEEDF
jgi:ubiquitin-like 1-activating enzyme E1 A